MSNIPIFPNNLSNEQNNINISSNLNNISNNNLTTLNNNDNNNNNNNNDNNNNNNDNDNNNNDNNKNNNNNDNNKNNNNDNNNNNNNDNDNNKNNDNNNNNNNLPSSENFQCVFNIQKDPKTSLIKANNFTYNDILNFSSIGLTAYESICNPRIIVDENNVKFTQFQIERVINEMLRCSICYDIFHDPVNLKKCLHKFCKKCIGDYNRKIKKECIICRNHIETRRLMKEDEKIKEIIDCIIPNVDLFKIEEDKELTKKIKDCLYKDEDKIKNQIEKTKKEDENESKEIKEKIQRIKINENFNNNISKNEQNIIDNNLFEKRINLNENEEQEQKIIEKINYNNISYNNNNNLNNNLNNNINENNLDFSSLLNKKINRENYQPLPNLNNININNFNNLNNNNNNNNLNLFNNNINNLNYSQNLKKINKNLISQSESFYDYYNNNNNNNDNSSMNILIKINCDEGEEDSLKKHFIQTRMKIQDFYTLDFISRFIVFKQNFKCDQIKKIIFYTLDSNNSKKYWKDHNIKIKAIVDFDRKIPQKLLESQKKISEFMYNNKNPIEYFLNLYFEISN